MDIMSNHSIKRSIDPSDSDTCMLPDFHKSLDRGCLRQKACDFGQFIDDLQSKHNYIYETVTFSGPKPSIQILEHHNEQTETKKSFNSNNYLGFSFRPKVLAGSKRALDEFGSSSGGSPLVAMLGDGSL